MSLIWPVRAVAGCVCLLAFVGSPTAQTYRGTLSGTVTDPAGAAVVGAAVTAINLDTGVAQEARADARGTYRLLNLEPGQYQLVVAHTGFETHVREPITIPA